MIRSGVAQLTVFISLAEVFLGVVGTSAKLHIVGLHAGKRSAGSEIGSDEKIGRAAVDIDGNERGAQNL